MHYVLHYIFLCYLFNKVNIFTIIMGILGSYYGLNKCLRMIEHVGYEGLFIYA